MFRTPLVALIVASAAMAAEPPALKDLLASQKARRAACEEGLRAIRQSCGTESAKWREARLLYRKTRERTNALVDALQQDLKEGGSRVDRSAQIAEAEATAQELQRYLDLARCDGTTAAAATEPEVPTAGLRGLVGHFGTHTRDVEGPRTDPESRRQVSQGLEEIRWKPAEALVPGAGEDPRVPRHLRLEGGFHAAAIRQMALDPGETTLLTAGEDKTVRVWDPATLELRRILRPPLDQGDSGRLYGVALTPDGRMAIIAGFTRDPDGGSHRLYLMDVRDGRLVLTLPGLPQMVNRLSLSPDGTRLVVHLGDRMGLRVYRLPDGAEVARDPLYNGPSYAGAFAADGRFVATSDDGFIRLYSPEFKILAKAKAPSASPFGVAFSPDGTTLALGYAEGCRVDLLSCKTLFPVARPDVKDVQGPLGVVAFARDGRTLYAGGGLDFAGRPNPICAWADGGRGARRDIPVSQATLSDLLPLKDGGLLAAAQDPRLLRLGPDLAVKVQREAMPGRLAAARQGLKVDAAGTTVALGWRAEGRPDLAWSLHQQGLQDVKEGLVAPLLAADRLKVEGWQDGEKPTLNGAALAGLEPHETVRTLSLARNAQSFVLGTDWSLRRFDATGRLERSAALPAACWGLNHTPDGRLVVAALADGTLRWYRATDLEELMALFPAADGQRWVLWNDEGWYAASVGGEGLLGWHVQREGEAGDFFPLAHFRDQRCQPRLFPALLETLDLTQALRALGLPPPEGRVSAGQPKVGKAAAPDLAMPPVLTVLSPEDGTPVAGGATTFRILARTYGEARPKAWHVAVDGEKRPPIRDLVPRADSKSPEVKESIYQLDLGLPARACRVTVAFETSSGVSEPVAVNLRAPAAQAAPAQTQAKAPVLHVVAVGISTYQDPRLRLTFAAKDARDVAGLFQGQRQRLYSEVKATTLTDAQATKAAILQALRDRRDKSTPDDVTLLFLSGHGISNPGSDSYFFLPADADAKVESTLVDGREIRDLLGATQGKVLLMLDTCHSGNVLGEGQMRSLDTSLNLTRWINELISADNGVMVFSSSTGRQLSMESLDWDNGAFTKALREGLEGKADPQRTGRVTLAMLDRYLRDRVKELTHDHQTPVSARPSALEFPLVILP